MKNWGIGSGRGSTCLLLFTLLPIVPVQIPGELEEGEDMVTLPLVEGKSTLTGSLEGSAAATGGRWL